MTEAELGEVTTSPENQQSPEGRRAGERSPLERWWSVLPDPHLHFGPLGLRHDERMHFCCFKPLSLW